MQTTSRHIRLIAALLLLVGGTAINAPAQEFMWNAGFRSVFDNREGDNNITATKTIIFTQLEPEIGVYFNSRRDLLAGGVVWTQPVGCEWEGHKLSPTLYYRHSERRLAITLGMLPRAYLHEELPDFLWCDSLAYFQRNIRGALVQASGKNYFADLYLDWRALQSRTRREAFNIVFHGQYRLPGRVWLAGGHLMMNHYALTEDAPEDMHIVDNFLVNPYIGADLSRKTGLDSLTVRAGALLTIERNRARDNWDLPGGGWLDLYGRWRFLEVRNTTYGGGRLLPSFNEFGGQLYQGEPYYRCRFYNRTKIYADIVRNRYVTLKAGIDLNFTDDTFVFYQKISVSVNLGQILPRHRGDALTTLP